MVYNQEFGESNLNQFLIDYHLLGYDTILPSRKLSTSQISEKILGIIHQITQHHMPEDRNLHIHGAGLILNISEYFNKITDKYCVGR